MVYFIPPGIKRLNLMVFVQWSSAVDCDETYRNERDIIMPITKPYRLLKRPMTIVFNILPAI